MILEITISIGRSCASMRSRHLCSHARHTTFSSMAVLPTGRRQGARAGAEALLLFAGVGHAVSSRLACMDAGKEREPGSGSFALNENGHTRFWLPASLYHLLPWRRLNTAFPSIMGIDTISNIN